jgi:hypothetical protein
MADDRHVEADPKTNFSAFKTFLLNDGVASSGRPEINNKLTLKSIEDAIRQSLTSRGLREDRSQPDIVVGFTIHEKGQRGVEGRGIRNAEVRSTSNGILVVDIYRGGTNELLWHGTSDDHADDAARLAKNLPGNAKKLLAEYPPRKK